jgi:hypothetical protein
MHSLETSSDCSDLQHERRYQCTVTPVTVSDNLSEPFPAVMLAVSKSRFRIQAPRDLPDGHPVVISLTDDQKITVIHAEVRSCRCSQDANYEIGLEITDIADAIS